MERTITITRDMLVWHDSQRGLYKSSQGYALVEYATGDVRYMSEQQAKDWLKRMGS